MPMESSDLSELKSLVKKARQRAVNFGVCLGKKPENTFMFMDLKKPAGVLMRNAKKAGETNKVTGGTVSVAGKNMTLTCEGDIPAGMARAMKVFFIKSDMPMKVFLADPNGNVVEGDDEDDEGDVTPTAAQAFQEASPGQNGSVNETPAEDAGDSGNDGAQEADPLAAQWNATEAKLTPMVEQFAAGNDPKAPAVGAAWQKAVQAANGGDFKSAMGVARKVAPLVAAAAKPAAAADAAQGDAPADPNEAKWATMSKELGDLYTAAMANNPENRSKLTAAYGMATEKAEAGDFKSAMAIAARLQPALIAAAQGGKGQDSEVPKDVVPFQKSRILWIDTRKKMFSEMKKLESAIVAACAGDEELAEVAGEVGTLTARLSHFDDKLETILDQITNSPEGDGRTKLKQQAVTAIDTYRAALTDPFFADVDQNGFLDVSIAASANQSLNAISKTLVA